MKKWMILVAVLAAAIVGQAQSAPAPLPGYSVTTFVGYSSLQSSNSGNGFFASLAVPLWTRNADWTWTVSARADNFLIASPSVNVLLAGPEVRYQFSQPTLFNGEVFQPFGNFMAGAARSSCVAATDCAVGQDTTSHFAYKVGGGLDMVLSANMTARLFEVDYIRSTIFPGGHVTLNNTTQITAAIGFHF